MNLQKTLLRWLKSEKSIGVELGTSLGESVFTGDNLYFAQVFSLYACPSNAEAALLYKNPGGGFEHQKDHESRDRKPTCHPRNQVDWCER